MNDIEIMSKIKNEEVEPLECFAPSPSLCDSEQGD